METIMDRPWSRPALTALGPIGFGSTYWVTHQFLPAGSPLWGSTLRALPAGIVLTLVVRRRPHGRQWARAVILGTINMGLFFLFAFLAAQHLPSSIAASIGAASPLVIAFFAWVILRERTPTSSILTAVLGIMGVLMVVGASTGGLDPVGVASSIAMLVLMALGATLNRRWNDGTPVLTSTAWQLVAAGLELLVVAVLVEGAPPNLDLPALGGVAYLSLFATALAYYCWFSGFQHLPATTVGILGLINPVTGVILGVVLGGEHLDAIQVTGILVVVASVLISQHVTSRKTHPTPSTCGTGGCRTA